MNAILSERQRRLLMYLATSDDWMTGRELAKLMDVSDRTIRTDIESIKKILSDGIIYTSKQKGYRLNRDHATDAIETEGIYLPQQRIVFMAVKIIIHKEGIDVFNLAEKMFVSESTIATDLVMLRKELSKINTELFIEREGDIIRLAGSLTQKNQLLIHLIKEFLGVDKIEHTQRFFEHIEVQEIVSDTLTILIEENYFSRYLSLRDLMITIFHICESSVLTKNEQISTESDAKFQENQMVMRIISYLEAKLDIDIPVSYQRLIFETIYSAQEMVNFDGIDNENGIVAKQITKTLQEIVDEIHDIYGLDFIKMNQLIADLKKHICIAIVRTRKGIRIRNPIKEKMKQEYPFLFDIGFHISKRIMQTVGVEFNSDEVSFIVCHLAEAYEEIQEMGKSRNKVKILLIAFEGKAVLKYIRRKIPILKDQEFLDFSEAVTLSELHDLKEQNAKFDLIVSTSLAQTDAYKPDLIIRPNIRSVDEFNITSWIHKEIDRLKRMNFSKFVTSFFREDLFETSVQALDSESYIRFSVDLLKAKNIVPDHFLSSVLEREHLISTAMPSQIALPHATSVNAYQSAVLVSIFQRPILWGDSVVKAAMLFAIAKSDIPELNRFYTFISKYVTEKENIDRLCKCCNFNEFVDLLFNNYMTTN